MNAINNHTPTRSSNASTGMTTTNSSRRSSQRSSHRSSSSKKPSKRPGQSHPSSSTRGAKRTKVQQDKLDPNNEIHAKRMASRARQVLKGKNTAGYDSYCLQVPVERRQKYNMETPSTPDATLDISNRKWQGILRAWRIALHKYDPPHLLDTNPEASPMKVSTPSAVHTQSPNLHDTTPLSMESSPLLAETTTTQASRPAPQKHFHWGSDSDSDDDLL